MLENNDEAFIALAAHPGARQMLDQACELRAQAGSRMCHTACACFRVTVEATLNQHAAFKGDAEATNAHYLAMRARVAARSSSMLAYGHEGHVCACVVSCFSSCMFCLQCASHEKFTHVQQLLQQLHGLTHMCLHVSRKSLPTCTYTRTHTHTPMQHTYTCTSRI